MYVRVTKTRTRNDGTQFLSLGTHIKRDDVYLHSQIFSNKQKRLPHNFSNITKSVNLLLTLILLLSYINFAMMRKILCNVNYNIRLEIYSLFSSRSFIKIERNYFNEFHFHQIR